MDGKCVWHGRAGYGGIWRGLGKRRASAIDLGPKRGRVCFPLGFGRVHCPREDASKAGLGIVGLQGGPVQREGCVLAVRAYLQEG